MLRVKITRQGGIPGKALKLSATDVSWIRADRSIFDEAETARRINQRRRNAGNGREKNVRVRTHARA